MSNQYHYATGKRKTSIARVRVHMNGSGKIEINGKPAADYFTVDTQLGTIKEPLETVEQINNVDVTVVVSGGGDTGQAQAIRHGIAQGLVKLDPDFRPALKRKGFLTRDARKVERKKPGLKKARRSPQWAKR
ncbi:MAG: 30S ribosomal protein S9 [Candidatus Gracilibacteria bacterium]|nr:30S ribosomal protein S9 [Candidatus Gracilibacteria bacterium]